MNDAAPALTLPFVIHALRASVGGWAGRGLFSAALAWLLYRRLGEIQRDMAGLMARFQSGRLWRVMTRASAKRPVPESVGSATACGVGAGDGAAGARIWPRDFGWLVRFAAYQAAGFGLQLRNVLTQPDMVALLAAAPRARRVLRPLCRMLAVETALLQAGAPRRHGPVAAGPEVGADQTANARSEPEAERPAQERVRAGAPPGIALPRGVLTAARRDRASKR
jgi:hypothetical protein